MSSVHSGACDATHAAIVKPGTPDRSRRHARRAMRHVWGWTKPSSRSASATSSIWRRPCSPSRLGFASSRAPNSATSGLPSARGDKAPSLASQSYSELTCAKACCHCLCPCPRAPGHRHQRPGAPTERQNDRTFAWLLIRRRLNIDGDLPPMNTQRLFLENDAEHVTTTFRNRRSGSIHPRSRSHLGTRHRYQVARRASATLASDNDLVDRWSRVPPGRGCRRIPPSLHLIARGSAARYGLEFDRTPVGSTPLLVPLVPTERPRSRDAQVLDLGRGTEGSNPVPSSGESGELSPHWVSRPRTPHHLPRGFAHPEFGHSAENVTAMGCGKRGFEPPVCLLRRCPPFQ